MKASANTKKLGDLADYDLIIQPHQRAYAWKQNDVISFFEDLKSVVAAAKVDSNPSHYFGTIFVAESKDGKHVIVDGQQRITTIFLCLKCILEKTDDENVASDVKRILFSHVRNEDIRLKSNNINRDVFEKIILDKEYVHSDEPDPSNEKLIKAYEELNRRVDVFKKDGESLYELSVALRNFTIIFINGSISDVHTIFSLINTRGVKLQKSDVIKSYLFSKSKPSKDIENDKKWTIFYRNVTGKEKGDFDNLDKFILHVLNIRCSPRNKIIKPNNMYNEIKKQIEKKEMSAESWIQEFEDWASIFVELRTKTKIDLGPYSPKYLEMIKDINSELIYRVLMAGYALLKKYERESQEKFIEQKNKFKNIIPLCLKYHLRVKTLASDSPESMKPLTDVARNIYANGKIDTKAIEEKLDKYKNDNIIAKKISNLKYKDTSAVKTLLFLLEIKSPAFQNKDTINIEHILPQKYEEKCENIHDLGNLTLLEEKFNNNVRDKVLSQKKETYLDSIFSETKNLARINRYKLGMNLEKEIESEEKRIKKRTEDLSNRIASLLQ